MAGEAVAAAFRLHPAPVHVEHWDAVREMSSAFAHIYRRGYIRLVDRHPLLWRAVYEASDRRTSRVTHALTRIAGRSLVERVTAWRPDAIVCTHFLAPEVLAGAYRSAKLRAPLHAVVTDRDMHRAWVWPAISRYHVASELVAARLALKYGVAPTAIQQSGIPVRPQFLQPIDASAARARLGLDPQRPTVLFLSGGFVSGGMARAIHGLWLERRDAQVIAICGRNARLRRRIERLARPSGAVLRPLGFVKDVAAPMSVADLVVAKSGGITTAECLVMGKPLVICASIAGQEERNADALVEAGAAVRAPSVEEVRWRLGRLLADDVRRAAMAQAAHRLAQPRAAQEVVEDVLAGVGVRAPAAGPYFHGAFRPDPSSASGSSGAR